MGYPWLDHRRPDLSKAERLRALQRQDGPEAIKPGIFLLVRQYRSRHISVHAFAQMLDVDPVVIPLWDAAEREASTRRLLDTDPAERAAADFAEIVDALAELNRRLAKPDIGDRSYTT